MLDISISYTLKNYHRLCYNLSIILFKGGFMRDFDFGTISDWSQKRINILNLIEEFPWEQKRDFKVLLGNIDRVVNKWDGVKVDYRRHPSTANTVKLEEAEKEFNQAITLLKKELLISKLFNY